jgi:hypothetical protein
MLRRVALVTTDVSEELNASFIRVTRIGELGTKLVVTSNRLSVFLRSVRRWLVTDSVVPSSPIRVTLIKEVLSSSKTSVLTRATRRNIPEDTIHHSHRREDLKSYILLFSFLGVGWTLGPSSPIIVTDEGGAKFLRNVGSYKIHTAEHPRRHNSS